MQATELGFSPAVVRLYRELTGAPETTVRMRCEQYAQDFHVIPLAPCPANFPANQASISGLSCYSEYNKHRGKTWPEFCDAMVKMLEHEQAVQNPFAPSWIVKAEGMENAFTKENLGLDTMGRTVLTKYCIQSSPSGAGCAPEDLFLHGPTSDDDFLAEIVDVMLRLKPLFVNSLGASDAEVKNSIYKWGPTLAPMAGLGMKAFRRFAGGLTEYDDWQAWSHASDAEIYKDVIEARQCTGYPVGLYRVDYLSLHWALQSQSMQDPRIPGKLVLPHWYSSLAALHLLKHARFWSDYMGKHYVVVMFNGTRFMREVEPHQICCSLTAICNRQLASEICNALNMPFSSQSRGREWYDDLVYNALRYIQIEHLARPRDMRSRIHLVPPPKVSTDILPDKNMVKPWVRPGINIRGVSGFDVRTGELSHDVPIEATDVVSLQWPFGVDRAADTTIHRSLLPDFVTPAPASDVIFPRIKNLNDLGHRRGLKILLDALITADLLRMDLLGTPIGNILPLEFPLVFALPTGSTEDETTGQGKTTSMRVVASTMVPGISVHVFSPSGGAPAQRSMSMPIEEHGTAILDEYSLPRTLDHFLAQAGLQALSTGSIVHPGRANDNCPGIRLAHPLFFTAKFAPRVPDILNRSFPIFLDQLTPETALTDIELAELMTGKLGIEARLRHLLWLKRIGLLDLLKRMPLATGKWRFNGHLGVAAAVAAYHGGCLEDVNAYLETARAMASEQAERAESSGLADSVSHSNEFDPRWYWEEASPVTLQCLEVMQNQKGGLLATEVIRSLVENGEKRVFARELNHHNTNEKGVSIKLAKALKRGAYYRADGWVLERVVTSSGNRQAQLHLRKIQPPPIPK
jgi:hypothetical protein